MAEIIKERPIYPESADYFASFSFGVKTPTSVSEDTIANFCKRCNLLQPNSICLIGSNKQARYVARNLCGWALVDGVKGEMTSKGFSGDKQV